MVYPLNKSCKPLSLSSASFPSKKSTQHPLSTADKNSYKFLPFSFSDILDIHQNKTKTPNRGLQSAWHEVTNWPVAEQANRLDLQLTNDSHPHMDDDSLLKAKVDAVGRKRSLGPEFGEMGQCGDAAGVGGSGGRIPAVFAALPV